MLFSALTLRTKLLAHSIAFIILSLGSSDKPSVENKLALA